jgi:AraC-like DNA-binding protein
LISGHHFKRIRQRRRRGTAVGRPDFEALRALLSQRVVARFARIGGAGLVAIPLVLSAQEDGEDPPVNPGHPACRKHANTAYCRESWQLHLAELSLRPETHWHKCDHKNLCALVPVICHGRCLAAVKLVCSSSVPEVDFERHVELLDMLVKDFVSAEADFLERLPRIEQAPAGLSPAPGNSATTAAALQPSHPQIVRALRYIEAHLSDPALTVGVVAREMGVNPNYLSHLFVDQVGQRMSGFIATRRVDLAKTLLATTHWQVKRIARDTGHANPSWFSHVFTQLTGLTPCAYRRKSRDA